MRHTVGPPGLSYSKERATVFKVGLTSTLVHGSWGGVKEAVLVPSCVFQFRSKSHCVQCGAYPCINVYREVVDG